MTKTRIVGGGLGWSACCVWIATSIVGCTAEIDESTARSDGSNLGEVSQALEQFIDRPAVAAVGVHGGQIVREMWVFACGTDNVLYRRVQPSWSSSWNPWTVASSIPCSGVATASAWSAQLWDEVEVFYRSTTGKLIELYYGPDKTKVEIDLSAYLGLGNINGNPVICDMGTNHRLSLAFRDTSNNLKTLTASPAAGWVIHSATNAAGQQVHADGLLTAMYTDQLSYLSSSLNGTYRVFTRTSWASGYVAINDQIFNSRGVLTFASPTPSTMLVLNRDGFDRVTKSAVVPGQPWNFTLANRTVVAATPHMGGSWSYLEARTWDYDQGLSYISRGEGEVTTLWGLDNSQTITYIYPTTNMRSAGTRPVNAGSIMSSYVFFASNNYRIYLADLGNEDTFNGNFVDMGINVVIP